MQKVSERVLRWRKLLSDDVAPSLELERKLRGKWALSPLLPPRTCQPACQPTRATDSQRKSPPLLMWTHLLLVLLLLPLLPRSLISCPVGLMHYYEAISVKCAFITSYFRCWDIFSHKLTLLMTPPQVWGKRGGINWQRIRPSSPPPCVENGDLCVHRCTGRGTFFPFDHCFYCYEGKPFA